MVIYLLIIVCAGVVAHRKGRRPITWMILTLIFPPIILVLFCSRSLVPRAVYIVART